MSKTFKINQLSAPSTWGYSSKPKKICQLPFKSQKIYSEAAHFLRLMLTASNSNLSLHFISGSRGQRFQLFDRRTQCRRLSMYQKLLCIPTSRPLWKFISILGSGFPGDLSEAFSMFLFSTIASLTADLVLYLLAHDHCDEACVTLTRFCTTAIKTARTINRYRKIQSGAVECWGYCNGSGRAERVWAACSWRTHWAVNVRLNEWSGVTNLCIALFLLWVPKIWCLMRSVPWWLCLSFLPAYLTLMALLRWQNAPRHPTTWSLTVSHHTHCKPLALICLFPFKIYSISPSLTKLSCQSGRPQLFVHITKSALCMNRRSFAILTTSRLYPGLWNTHLRATDKLPY